MLAGLKELAQVTIPSSTVSIPKVNADDATFQNITSKIFIAIGAMAVLFIIVGAITYITSNGEQTKIQQAKNTIVYAVIGLVISALAFTIVQFILGRFV